MTHDSELVKQRIEDFYNGDVQDYHARNYISAGSYSPLKYRQYYIENMIAKQQLPKNAKILDVGCGPGELISNLLKKGYNVWGVDISRGMIDEATDTIRKTGFRDWNQAAVGDIERLQFEDNYFDVVIASGVIEYQKDDRASLLEMHRVLKPNGLMILNVTNRRAYVTALESLFVRFKRNRVSRAFLETIKSSVLRQGKIKDRQFHPDRRTHVPTMFDRQVADAGFEKVSHNYFHFSLLPKPFDHLLGRINSSVANKMEALLTRSRVGFLGGGYLILARKRAAAARV